MTARHRRAKRVSAKASLPDNVFAETTSCRRASTATYWLTPSLSTVLAVGISLSMLAHTSWIISLKHTASHYKSLLTGVMV